MSSSMKKVEGYVGSTDLFKIDPCKIVIRDGWNPRSALGDLEDLKASIRDNGFYPDKALLLYRRGADLELISGHRRLHAVLELIEEGVPIIAVPALLDQTGDEGERLARALSANQNSVPLDPMDEAQAFQRLAGYGWEPKRIASKVGRSLSYVYGRLKLLEATADVIDAASRGEITQTEVVRTVERASRDGISQTAALEQTVKERRERKAHVPAERKAHVPAEREARKYYDDEAHRGLIQDVLDVRGVVWVVAVLLDYADKEEVLDAVQGVTDSMGGLVSL